MNINLQTIFEDKLPAKYRDKVFWYASKLVIDDKNKSVDIYIDSKNCLVTFENFADELNLKSVEEISKLSTKNNIKNHPVLVSSGSFLWINNKLVVTQRTADTKFDPLYWTTPAGRCDTTPLNTAYKETAEEIHGFHKITNELWMPEQTIKYISNDMKNTQKINSYKAEKRFPENINIKVSNINTWIDNKLVETAKMRFYYSESVNTLELRLPLYANIEESLYFKNTEFDTQTMLVSIEELQSMKIVPAVKKIIEEIKNQ